MNEDMPTRHEEGEIAPDPCTRPFGFTCPAGRDRSSCTCTCQFAALDRCRDTYCGTLNLCVLKAGRSRNSVPKQTALAGAYSHVVDPAALPQNSVVSPGGRWTAFTRIVRRKSLNSRGSSLVMCVYLALTDEPNRAEVVLTLATPLEQSLLLSWPAEDHLQITSLGTGPCNIRRRRHGDVEVSMLENVLPEVSDALG
jgi:hypothetical protein